MKVTKNYCDCCGKEVNYIYTLDLDLSTSVNNAEIRVLGGFGAPRDFGKVTCDGSWELELCHDCMDKTVNLLKGMKTDGN